MWELDLKARAHRTPRTTAPCIRDSRERSENVIVVGAEGDEQGERLHAPGADILVPVPGGGFDYASGSSLSAAQVTGVVALMLAARPGIGLDEVARLLSDSSAEYGGSVNACRVLAKMLQQPGCRDVAAAYNGP